MPNLNNKDYYKNRQFVFIGTVILIALAFILRLFFLQIAADKYKMSADSNAFLKRTRYPARGNMYDRNGKLTVFNQPAYDVMMIMREVQPFDTTDFCSILKISKEQFNHRIEEIKDRHHNPGYSTYVPQVFMNQLSAQDCGVLQEKLYKFPGFYIRNRTIRQYTYPYAGHVLGTIGEVNRTDIKQDSYYVQGDYSGRTGIEKSYEKILRGEKGVSILLRDAHGRVKGRYKNGLLDRDPLSGKDLKLSLDMDLQGYGEHLLQNKIGAITMIEPSTGEVLCMVSSPSFDPNMLVGRKRGENSELLQKDPLKPLYSRALQGQYPPGSTFKPAQALIYLQEGVIDTTTLYSCHGGYPLLHGHPACHNHASPLSVIPAIAISCNSFFCWGLHNLLDNRAYYPSPQKALNVWKDHMVSMGYGYPLGIDIPGEKRGYIPNSSVYDKIYNKRWSSSTLISIAIGQGEILATPLQICNLSATIANQGYYIAPHVVKGIQNSLIDSTYRHKHYTDIEQKYYTVVAEGMHLAVTGGTCRGTNVIGLDICGKTGTAENPHGKDHSIFMGFAPKDHAKVAISVLIENGGFGATYAVPIARLMFEKYLTGHIAETDKWIEDRIVNTVILPTHEK
ncbi:MAG: penicillin-binding transpeptidase domain-containing protein [Massilibacteroides sp.]|nr:penicillin-binding transpeptidase domain-containing protein [Massilibacteroides sp.]